MRGGGVRVHSSALKGLTGAPQVGGAEPGGLWYVTIRSVLRSSLRGEGGSFPSRPTKQDVFPTRVSLSCNKPPLRVCMPVVVRPQKWICPGRGEEPRPSQPHVLQPPPRLNTRAEERVCADRSVSALQSGVSMQTSCRNAAANRYAPLPRRLCFSPNTRS